MPVLPAVEGEAWLVFDTAPDEITVKAWPVSKWGDLSAVDKAIVVPVSGDKITLLEGGHIYEVFAKWTRFEEFGGAAYYSFYTSPLGVTLTAEDVTPNGLTLVCTQSGGAPTGELQTGSRFWLEVYSESNWFPVKTIWRMFSGLWRHGPSPKQACGMESELGDPVRFAAYRSLPNRKGNHGLPGRW